MADQGNTTTPPGPGAGDGTHPDGEDHSWKIRIPDHAARKESAAFRSAKDLAHKIVASLPGKEPFGGGPWQMHHGGSLWVFSAATGWRLFLNTVGIEWSAQFCADPAKVDLLRLNARVLYNAFPETAAEMVRLGYQEAQQILDTAITDADTVATWVDSVFNSCVPLAAPIHTGVLPSGGGRHHYPTPVTDIEQIKFADFTLWVTDKATNTQVAVVPTGTRGSGDGRVTLTFAPPGHPLAEQKAALAMEDKRVIFLPDSDLAKQAFADQ